jgi:hypothetical protein
VEIPKRNRRRRPLPAPHRALPQLFGRMNQAFNSGRAGFLEVDIEWKKLDDTTFVRVADDPLGA